MRQVKVADHYKGRAIGCGRLDRLVGRLLPVEIKAVEALAPIQQAQVISYLEMASLRLGLLIIFNAPALRLGIKRVILTP